MSVSRQYGVVGVVFGLGLFLSGCGKSAGGGESRRAPVYPNPPSEEEYAPKATAASSDSLAAGTVVEVECLDAVDSDTIPKGAFVPIRVLGDVKGQDGRVAIPTNTSGVLMVLESNRVQGNSGLILGLYQLSIGDKSYLLTKGSQNLATLELREDASKGAGHRSVHLVQHTALKFTVSQAVTFKK